MGTFTFLAYIVTVTLIISCWGIVHRLVSNQIADIDLRNLTVVQFPMESTVSESDKVGISTFLEHGPVKNREYIFRNGQAIEFYTRKFRMIVSVIEVLYFAIIIWGIIIFSRLSAYGIDVTTENFTRSILDFFIVGYFVIWLYFLHKMRHVTTTAKLNYNRYIS
jgi:hypothetical protein